MTAYTGFDAWRQAFAADPMQCLDRLLREADSVSPLERGRPADAALRALQGTEPGLIELADQALCGWLEARLQDEDGAVTQRGVNAYFTYVNEGLTLAGWLPMPQTGKLLRQEYANLRDWARRRSLGEGSGDLEATLSIALAHNQTDDSRRFFWLAQCEQAGRKAQPEIADLWFGIALQGLRGMAWPNEGSVPIAVLAEALARWAQGLKNIPADQNRFDLQWRALQSAHPHQPSSWAQAVGRLLDRFALRPFAAWWQDALDLPAPFARCARTPA